MGINPSIQAHTHQQSSRSCTRSSATGEAAGQKWDSSAPRYCTTALPVMAGVELGDQCPLQPLIPDNSQKGPFHHLWRVQTSSARHNLSASSSCAVRGMPALALSLCQKKKGRMWGLRGKNSRNKADCTVQSKHIHSRSQCALKGKTAKFSWLLKEHRVTQSHCRPSQQNFYWEQLWGQPLIMHC